MANKAKTYFLVPGWDFPVGSIQLGAVIADPAFPHRALNEDDLVPIDTKIHPSDKYDFSSTIDKSRSNKFGLWAQFLQIFGLGGGLSVAFDKGAIDSYSFKHMHTEWFLPSAAFAIAEPRTIAACLPTISRAVTLVSPAWNMRICAVRSTS